MKIVIFCPNINSGGGLTLLKDLVIHAPDDARLYWFLSDRVINKLDLLNNENIFSFPNTFFGRFYAEYKLSKFIGLGDHVLFFNGSPSILNIESRKSIYLQNKLLFSNFNLSDFGIVTRIRLLIEKLLIKYKLSNFDFVYVQTRSMRSAVINSLKPSLFDKNNIIMNGFAPSLFPNPHSTSIEPFFFYPASFFPHKNHLNLFKAWLLFSEEINSPKLVVTLSPEHFNALCSSLSISEILRDKLFINVGQIDHDSILDLYSQSKAVIFPSILESFGLPLIEASQLKIPVLASDLDYVYDVCNPTLTFDPLSIHSIFSCVCNFLSTDYPLPQQFDYDNSSVFWSSFLSKISSYS